MRGTDNILSHLSDGYRNAQETIRALDTKTNILTVLSAFAFTAILGMLKTAWDYTCAHAQTVEAVLTGSSQMPLILALALVGLLIVSLFLGSLCIWACLATLTARAPSQEIAFVSSTILFPYLPPVGRFGRTRAQAEYDNAKAYYDKITTGQITEADILSEYHNQIMNLGSILGKKILWNRRAVGFFRWQIITIPVLVMIFGILASTGLLQ